MRSTKSEGGVGVVLCDGVAEEGNGATHAVHLINIQHLIRLVHKIGTALRHVKQILQMHLYRKKYLFTNLSLEENAKEIYHSKGYKAQSLV